MIRGVQRCEGPLDRAHGGREEERFSLVERMSDLVGFEILGGVVRAENVCVEGG